MIIFVALQLLRYIKINIQEVHTYVFIRMHCTSLAIDPYPCTIIHAIYRTGNARQVTHPTSVRRKDNIYIYTLYIYIYIFIYIYVVRPVLDRFGTP